MVLDGESEYSRVFRGRQLWTVGNGAMIESKGIRQDTEIRSIHGDAVVRVVQVDPRGHNRLRSIDKDKYRSLNDQTIFQSNKPRLESGQVEHLWAFDAPNLVDKVTNTLDWKLIT